MGLTLFQNGLKGLTAGPSLADVLAFEALPVETQELARRVVGAASAPDDLVALVAKAYEEGFEDCADEIDISRPHCSERHAKVRAAQIIKERAA
jgi:hypothetical protein